MTTPPAWRQVRQLLEADRARLTGWLAPAGLKFSRWHPGYICVFLYRVSHYLHLRDHRLLARALWQLNSILTACDIPPAVEIGPGLLVPVPAGVVAACRAGCNFTILMGAGLGGELGRREDVGAGPGLPVVGNDVILEPHAGVLGPLRIGDRAVIKASASVVSDVPADTCAVPPEVRFLKLTVARR